MAVVDSEALFGEVSLARSKADYLESLIFELEPEHRELLLAALAPLRKQLKEIHYMCIPWAS